LQPGSVRTPLPIPLAPGRSLTFPIKIDVETGRWHPRLAGVRPTLVHGASTWWMPSERWTPPVLPIASLAATAEAAAPQAAADDAETLRLLLAQAQIQLESVKDVGPNTLKLARFFHGLSSRFPRTVRTCKGIVKFVTRSRDEGDDAKRVA
jgi:hypothetical protein